MAENNQHEQIAAAQAAAEAQRALAGASNDTKLILGTLENTAKMQMDQLLQGLERLLTHPHRQGQQQQRLRPTEPPEQGQNIMRMPTKLPCFPKENDKTYKFSHWLEDVLICAEDNSWNISMTHRRALAAVSGEIRDKIKTVDLGFIMNTDELCKEYTKAVHGENSEFNATQLMMTRYKQEYNESLEAFRRRISSYQSILHPGWENDDQMCKRVVRMLAVGLNDKALYRAVAQKDFDNVESFMEFCRRQANVEETIKLRFNGPNVYQFPKHYGPMDEESPMEIDHMRQIACYRCGEKGHMKRNCRNRKKRNKPSSNNFGSSNYKKRGKNSRGRGGRSHTMRRLRELRSELSQLQSAIVEGEDESRQDFRDAPIRQSA